MFPISKDKLSIGEISDYWSREIQPKASRSEIRGLLEGAWWRGEIIGDAQVSRLELLKNMFKFKDRKDVRIVFMVDQEASAPQRTELPGGDAEFDIRPRVCLPSSQTDSWTEASCTAAFQTLAETMSVEDFPLIAPVFSAINFTRNEFVTWLAKRGSPVPRFWKSNRRTASNERRLNIHVRNGEEHGSRASIDTPESSAGVVPAAAKSIGRSRRGPVPGTVDRYGEADRALFPEIDRLVREGQMSPTAAAHELALAGRVSGVGTEKSRAKRLAKRYIQNTAETR